MTVDVAIPQHHPDADILLAYASGSLAEGFALVVATHLLHCGTCRRIAGDLDAVGGVLFEELAPTALESDAFARTMACIDDRPPEAPTAQSSSPTPTHGNSSNWWHWQPLSQYLGGQPPRLWRPLGPGIGYSPIKRRGRSGASAILLRVAAKAALPRHGHAGAEMNIVLAGGYRDAMGSYGVGDFSLTDAAITHQPIADNDAVCISLVALAGPLLFGGKAARWLQAIAGI
jgi:putative transcriptional regulator